MTPFEVRQSKLLTQLKEYYRSSNWSIVSKIVKERDKVCQVCFVNDSVHAHHLTYKSVYSHGVTFPLQCVGVCKECHEMLHNKTIDYGV
jgi:hypothetical protein